MTRVSEIKQMSDCEELFGNSSGVDVARIGWWPIDTETFNVYREEILQHFTPRPEIIASVDTFLRHIAIEMKEEESSIPPIPLVFVGVHVRRTDYEEHMKELLHGSLVTMGYFDAAMTWFQKRYKDSKVIFVLVSDDSEWTRKMFQQRRDVVFASSGHR